MDEDGALEALVSELSKLTAIEIIAFDDMLSKCLYDLDTKIHAGNSGDSGESGDGFLYLRCYVIGCGEEYYANCLTNPKKMPKSTDNWFESLLYVPQLAWSNVTGSDPSEYNHQSSFSIETGSNDSKW